MTNRELMQQALDALEEIHPDNMTTIAEKSWSKAIEALRAVLAQPEQTPTNNGRYLTGYKAQPEPLPLYTAPPQREWQTLTENEIKHLWYEACQTNLELTSQLIVHLARNIEAKLKEKNT